MTFHQPMSLRPFWMGMVIDIRVEMRLREEEGGKTVVERDVFLGLPVLLWAFKGMVEREFRRESWRTMEALKKFLVGG